MASLYGITDKPLHPIALANIPPPIVPKLLLHHMVSDLAVRMSLLPPRLIPMAHSPTMPSLIKLDPNHLLLDLTMMKMLPLCLLRSISSGHHPGHNELLLLLLSLLWLWHHYPLPLHLTTVRAYQRWDIIPPVIELCRGEDQSLLPKRLPSLLPQHHSVGHRFENQPSYLVDHIPPSILGEVPALKVVVYIPYLRTVMGHRVGLESPTRHQGRSINYIISILPLLLHLLIHRIKHKSSRLYRRIRWKVGCRFRIETLLKHFVIPKGRWSNLQPRIKARVVYHTSVMTRQNIYR